MIALEIMSYTLPILLSNLAVRAPHTVLIFGIKANESVTLMFIANK